MIVPDHTILNLGTVSALVKGMERFSLTSLEDTCICCGLFLIFQNILYCVLNSRSIRHCINSMHVCYSHILVMSSAL